jgi:hypothetical protein
MRDIILDMTNPCPGVLARSGSTQVIGCAMGEVLFQAGVPLCEIDGVKSVTDLYFSNYHRYDQMVAWLGLDDREGRISDFSNIEGAYDRFLRAKFFDLYPTVVALFADDLKDAGRRVNVNFILDSKPQAIACAARRELQPT